MDPARVVLPVIILVLAACRGGGDEVDPSTDAGSEGGPTGASTDADDGDAAASDDETTGSTGGAPDGPRCVGGLVAGGMPRVLVGSGTDERMIAFDGSVAADEALQVGDAVMRVDVYGDGVESEAVMRSVPVPTADDVFAFSPPMKVDNSIQMLVWELEVDPEINDGCRAGVYVQTEEGGPWTTYDVGGGNVAVVQSGEVFFVGAMCAALTCNGSCMSADDDRACEACNGCEADRWCVGGLCQGTVASADRWVLMGGPWSDGERAFVTGQSPGVPGVAILSVSPDGALEVLAARPDAARIASLHATAGAVQWIEESAAGARRAFHMTSGGAPLELALADDPEADALQVSSDGTIVAVLHDRGDIASLSIAPVGSATLAELPGCPLADPVPFWFEPTWLPPMLVDAGEVFTVEHIPDAWSLVRCDPATDTKWTLGEQLFADEIAVDEQNVFTSGNGWIQRWPKTGGSPAMVAAGPAPGPPFALFEGALVYADDLGPSAAPHRLVRTPADGGARDAVTLASDEAPIAWPGSGAPARLAVAAGTLYWSGARSGQAHASELRSMPLP